MDGSTSQPPGWPQGPQRYPDPGQPAYQDYQDPGQGYPGGQGPVVGSGIPPSIYIAGGAVIVLAIAIVVVLLTDGGSDGGGADTEETAARAAEEESREELNPETEGTEETPAATEDPEGETTSGSAGLGDLPAPDTSVDASPPDIYPEIEDLRHPIDPFSDIYWPILGEVYVDVEPGGYVDVPVQLEAEPLVVISAATDGMDLTIETFDPEGESIAQWDVTPKAGVVEGWEFTDAPLEAGTHVFRVIHEGGRDDGFPLRFFHPE